ncbi:hypothetical protein XBKQ1_2210001 [Xenorhabdus bovienii str. kraussei Quebec]|uniref:Uncharacterized protein n=1 Tax=Xenorhabdus bovienii str. kraussei Quebec TaxID=1398203 RepID=A0A077PG05_XENBV|nr:hypothetical protein XBKQ1_2210001 [Xenorhabdus bovienii str. kraussei Quebec]
MPNYIDSSISHHDPMKVAMIITVVVLIGSVIYLMGDRGGKETIETKQE